MSAFIQTLATKLPSGVSAQELLRFADAIGSDDLQVMAQAIEEGCEKVNGSGW